MIEPRLVSNPYDKHAEIAAFFIWVEGQLPNLTQNNQQYVLRFTAYLKKLLENERYRLLSYYGYQDHLTIVMHRGIIQENSHEQIFFMIEGDHVVIRKQSKQQYPMSTLSAQLLHMS